MSEFDLGQIIGGVASRAGVGVDAVEVFAGEGVIAFGVCYVSGVESGGVACGRSGIRCAAESFGSLASPAELQQAVGAPVVELFAAVGGEGFRGYGVVDFECSGI